MCILTERVRVKGRESGIKRGREGDREGERRSKGDIKTFFVHTRPYIQGRVSSTLLSFVEHLTCVSEKGGEAAWEGKEKIFM